MDEGDPVVVRAARPCLKDWTDQELLSAYASTGARDALATLIARHAPAVHGVCRRILRDEHAAEDAVQAVFLAFCRKAPALHLRSNVASWLHRAAVLAALKTRRRRAAYARSLGEYGRIQAMAGDTGVPDQELLSRLDETLNELPERTREAVVLRYLHRRSQEQVAGALGCTVASAAHRISRGLARLRELFARRGHLLSAGALAALLGQAQPVSVSAALLNQTIAVCLGETAATGATLATAKAVNTALWWAKAKAVLAIVTLTLGLSVAGGALWMSRGPQAPPNAMATPPAVPAVESDTAGPPPAKPSANGRADWPAWRGDGSGSANCGAQMVDSLDQAKFAWQSEPVGLSGCMYPGGSPGEGWCDPIISDGRVFVYWFRRAGADLVDLHCLPASRGWASLIDPPDAPEAFARGGGHRSSLPSKEMSAIQRHIRADDIITCLDDRTGKKLWERVFPARGINNVRVYGALCVLCVKDGRVYAIGSSMKVYALDAATGKTIWQSDIGERTEQFDQAMETFARSRHRGSDIGTAADTSVVCADGVVAVGESSPPVEAGRGGAGLVGLDAATGRRLWRVPDCLDRLGSPAVWRHDGKEYFLAASERMVLIEPKTGKELWSVGGKDDRITDGCTPAVSGEYVVVAKNVAKTVGANAAKWWRGPSCYRLSLDGAKLVWALPMVDGISLIAPSIMDRHAYVCVKEGVAAVELETGKTVGRPLPGFSSAYAGYAAGDGLIFRLGKIAKALPEMKALEGVLPGKPDYGEIHAPAVANGRVYWRGKRSVWCYDFRKSPPPPSNAALPAARDLNSIKDNPQQLAAAIEKEGWPTRAVAAELLRLLGEKGKSAAPTIQKALLAAVAAKDWGDVDLLIEVLRASEASALKPAAPALAKLLDQTDELTLRLAFHALALMGPQASEAVPALTKHLDPAKPQLAALAARALCQIGPGAQAAVPGLLKCLEAKDEDLTRQAAKALCHLAPADSAARAAAIDAVLAHPGLYSKIGWGAAPPRRNSYKAVCLSLLGKEAVPQMLERAKAIIELGAKPYKKGEPQPKVNYSNVCELANAAFAIDPKSASDFLLLLAKIPRKNPPVVDTTMLSMTEKDLNGTLDQRDPLGHVKMKEQSAKDKKAPPPKKKEEQKEE